MTSLHNYDEYMSAYNSNQSKKHQKGLHRPAPAKLSDLADSLDALQLDQPNWRKSHDAHDYMSEKMAARRGWGLSSKFNSQSSPRLQRAPPRPEDGHASSVRELDRRDVDLRSAFFRKNDQTRSPAEEVVGDESRRDKRREPKSSFEAVKVYLRIRPPTSEYTFIDNIAKNKRTIEITKDFEIKAFGFSKIISPKEKQLKAFAVTCSDVLKGILQGFNGCLIAYGQTGSGKTFTILGDQSKGEKGLLQLSLAYLLASQKKIWLEISAVQIYMNNIYDIFDSGSESTSTSRRSMKFSNRNPAHYQIAHMKKVSYNYVSKDGMKLHDLLTFRIESIEDVEEVVLCINENRRTAKTDMNDKSSRSHAVFMVKVHNPDFAGYATFYLVDLAGSERLKKSQIKDKITMDETISINESLMALSKCVSALVKRAQPRRRKKGKSVSPSRTEPTAKGKGLNATGGPAEAKRERSKHIPFRDSRLTMLLQNCLLGKSLLSLIVTISPDDRDVDESFSTLRFGQCAAKVEVKPMKTFEIEQQKKIEEEQQKKQEKAKQEKQARRKQNEQLKSQMEQLDREMNRSIQKNLSKNIKSLEEADDKNVFRAESDGLSVATSLSRREELMNQLILEKEPVTDDSPGSEERRFEMYERRIREQASLGETGEADEKREYAEGNNSNFTFRQQDGGIGSSGLQNSLYQNITQNVMGPRAEAERRVVDSEIVDSNVLSSLVQDSEVQLPTSLSHLIKDLKQAKQDPTKISEVIGELRK